MKIKKGVSSGFTSLLLICLPLSSAQSFPPPSETSNKTPINPEEKPVFLLASLGDSLTAASLADTSLTHPVVADRDKILDRSWKWENRKTLSWASGEKIKAHNEYLGDYLAQHGDTVDLDTLNVANPGNRADDLENQAQKVVDKMESGDYQELTYITLLIGANDACSDETERGTPISDFKASVHKALKKLSEIKQATPLRILVSSIPKIADLAVPEIRHRRVYPGLTCHDIRVKVFHECNPLLNWKTEEEHQQKNGVVKSFNDALKEVVAEAKQLYPNMTAVYSSALWDAQITAELLAVDCFHPNRDGQQLVSNQLWQDQPWFR